MSWCKKCKNCPYCYTGEVCMFNSEYIEDMEYCPCGRDGYLDRYEDRQYIFVDGERIAVEDLSVIRRF